MRTVEAAQRAVDDAEAQIAKDQHALADAREQLDQALAAKGWRRVHGGFDGALYSHVSTPGYLTPLEQVLEAVTFEPRAAA